MAIIQQAAKSAKHSQAEKYKQYAENSLSFVEKILGETLPDCLKPIFESWDKYQITVLVSATSVGKTYSLARLALHSYICQMKPKIFMAAAPPEDNLRLMLWYELLSASYKCPDLLKYDKITDLMVAPLGEDNNEEKKVSRLIKGLIIPSTGDPHQREAKFSGKHAPYLGFILDEGDAIPPEVYKGIDGCQSGGKTRLMIAFNPRKQSGPVWDLIKSGRARVIKIGAFDHPNVITGKNIIPGAVTQEKTVQRINMWTRPLMPGEKIDQDCFQIPNFLVGKQAALEGEDRYYEPLPAGWRKIEDQQFHYKVLAQYPTQSESSLIPKLWFDRAVENGKRYVAQYGGAPPVGMKPRLGYDVAETLAGDDNVISSRWDWLMNVGVDRWKGMDIIDGADRAERRYNEMNAAELLVDATGVGAGTAPYLRRKKVNVSGVKVAQRPTQSPGASQEAIHYRLREQLMWDMRQWFSREDAALIPYSVKLEEQFLFWQYTIENGEIKCSKKDEFKKIFGYSPDDFDSALLTFGATMRPSRAMFGYRYHSFLYRRVGDTQNQIYRDNQHIPVFTYLVVDPDFDSDKNENKQAVVVFAKGVTSEHDQKTGETKPLNCLWTLEYIYDFMTPAQVIDAIIKLHRKYYLNSVIVKADGGKRIYAPMMNEKINGDVFFQRYPLTPIFSPYHEGDRKGRIYTALQPRMDLGQIFIREDMDELEEEFQSFDAITDPVLLNCLQFGDQFSTECVDSLYYAAPRHQRKTRQDEQNESAGGWRDWGIKNLSELGMG